jgi:hypothetical protein
MKSIAKGFVTLAMATTLATGTIAPRPAPAAISQGTVNTLLGVAAAVGAIVLYNNYVHKRQAANSVVGYTANGGTVYGDGRIVMPNGQTVYPGPNGYYPWGQPAYYTTAATPSTYQYDYDRSGRYDSTGRHGRGHAYGHFKHHGGGEAEGRER